jgi:hypothetical protein
LANLLQVVYASRWMTSSTCAKTQKIILSATAGEGAAWIPGFTSGSDDRSQSADTSPENTEAPAEDEFPEGEDPAIKMSGE